MAVGGALGAPVAGSTVSGPPAPPQGDVISAVHLHFQRTTTGEMGLHIHNVVADLAPRGISSAEVHGAVDLLVDEGYIYSTVDDAHFKATVAGDDFRSSSPLAVTVVSY